MHETSLHHPRTRLNVTEKRLHLAGVWEFTVSVPELLKGELNPALQWNCSGNLRVITSSYHFLPLSCIFAPPPSLIISSPLPLVVVSCSEPPALFSKLSFYLICTSTFACHFKLSQLIWSAREEIVGRGGWNNFTLKYLQITHTVHI